MENINKWLSIPISKYSELTNKEYINIVYSLLINFISKNNLIEKYNRSQSLKYLYAFIYDKNIINSESCEIIDMNYTSDIIDIYFTIKDKIGLEVLESKKIYTDELLIFLNYIVEYFEDEDNISNDENLYEDENIM